MAATVLDVLLTPALVEQAWTYFRDVQTKDQKYVPFITDKDPPAITMNTAVMAKYREEMKKYYYDPTKYKTYLEQLGITYPTVRTEKRRRKTKGLVPGPRAGHVQAAGSKVARNSERHMLPATLDLPCTLALAPVMTTPGLSCPGAVLPAAGCCRSTNSICPFRLRSSSSAHFWSDSRMAGSMRSRNAFRSATRRLSDAACRH